MKSKYGPLKRLVKLNSHNAFLKIWAGLGRSINRLYENRNHDPFTNGEVRVLKLLGKENPQIIVDGGANVGNYTQMIRNYCPYATIHAFEPVLSTVEQFKETTKHLENVTIHPLGLYSSKKSMEINLFDSSTHSSLYDIEGVDYSANSKGKIELINGDAFMEWQHIDHIDFLKLDLEGAEYDALLGFKSALESGKIMAIQFEYGYINISSKFLLADFYKLLEGFGYVLGKIYPKSVEFRDYAFKHEDFIGPNILAVHKSATSFIENLKNK